VHDVAFVGRVNAYRHKRSRILARLAERFPRHAFAIDPQRALDAAETAAVYQQARIVIAESLVGDLTFRVFEGMACGALVLAERVENGLATLFPPGEVLDVFNPDDLVEKTAWWLAHEAERARVAARGAALIAARHDMRHRMAEVCALIARGVARRDTRARGARDWALAASLAVARGVMDPARTIPHILRALARALEEDDVDALLAIAELAVATGEVERARRLLDHARRTAPGDPRPAALAAALAARAGDPLAAAAEIAVGRALEAYGLGLWVGFVAAPPFDLPRTAWDWYLRALSHGAAEAGLRAGELALGAGCVDAAVEEFRRAVELVPADTHARARLAAALRRAYCGDERA
jgi:tetratricopeptide (TPR) repeat protein